MFYAIFNALGLVKDACKEDLWTHAKSMFICQKLV